MSYVADIMNRELFHLRPGDLLLDSSRFLLALGITAAPVLGEDGVPLGVLSLRDCMEAPSTAVVADRMTTPAVAIRSDAPVEAAARLLAETQLHRLVVTDAEGKAVGMVSAVDVIRADLGLPPRHPAAFPHYDVATGLTWTDDTPLELDRIEAAPAGPGVLLLIDAGGESPRIVWGEWTHDLRTRLVDLLSLPQREAPLARILERGSRLWFRAAQLAEGPMRKRVVETLIAREMHGETFVVR